MTNIELSFIKKRFGTVAAAQTASQTPGAIVFDKEHHVICVNGDVYGGQVQDVTFANSILTVTKADGSSFNLNFSDVASAQGTMAVFGQLRDIIGITNAVQDVQSHYDQTAYLQGAQSLIGADVLLDAQMLAHKERMDNMNGTATIATQSGKQVTIKHGIVDTQGVVSQDQGDDVVLADVATSGEASDVHVAVQYGDTQLATDVEGALNELLQGAIDREEVVEAAFQAVQNAVGLDEHLNYVQKGQSAYLQGAQSVDQALTELDDAIKNVVVESKSYAIVQGTTSEGYLKTYYLEQTVNGTSTQAGVKIDIPKDFLVKSATTATVQQADLNPNGKFYDVTSAGKTHDHPSYEEGGVWYSENWAVGDVYIDFVINTREGSVPDEHLYINVNSMVDSYTGDTATVIVNYNDPSFTDREGRADVNIDQTNNRISVTVNDGAITTNKLAAAAVQTAKIYDRAVTSQKIALQGVTNENIGDQAVQNRNLAPEVVQVGTQEVYVNQGATTIATVGGKEIKVAPHFYWSEWVDDEPQP